MLKAEGSTKRGRVVCLDSAGSAFRGFVWKLCLVYGSGFFDKSQRLESIVGGTITIRGRDTAIGGGLPFRLLGALRATKDGFEQG